LVNFVISDIKRKQLTAIGALSSESTDHHKSLDIHETVPRDVDSRLEADIQRSAEHNLKIAKDIHSHESEREIELDASISLIRNRLQSSRIAATKTATSEAISKYISVLEKRLEKSVIRFNDIIHSNSLIREQVDSLRLEHQTHAKITEKLVQEIERTKKLSEEAIDDTNSAYCAKDKAASDLIHLKTIADREYAEFQREWRELNRLLESDRKIHDFVIGKTQFPQSALIVPTAAPPSSITPPIEDRIEPEPSARIPSIYESYFERIKESIGIVEIEKLLSKFLNSETMNFSLFNQLNDISGQVDLFIAKLESQSLVLAELKSQGSILNKQSPRLDTESNRARFYSEKIDDMNRRWSRIDRKVSAILECVGFGLERENDDSVIADDSSENEVPKNILKNLSQIEEKITPLLSRYKVEFGQENGIIRKSSNVASSNRAIFFSDIIPSSTNRRLGLSNLPSSIAVDVAMNDDDVRPLTRAELYIKRDRNLICQKPATTNSRAPSAASTRPSTSKRSGSTYLRKKNEKN